MNTSIPPLKLTSKRSLRVTSTLLLAGLVLLSFGAPRSHADVSPPGCTGSGLGISLFARTGDVHIGDTLTYSVLVFNTPMPVGAVIDTPSPSSATVSTRWFAYRAAPIQIVPPLARGERP